mmetsp:Transcript_17094/g.46887  ORF Transcript_17094/g.46887 Transcript_17094/m.46887 type:complete len:87 (-) Transcript_17094:47-307(-)
MEMVGTVRTVAFPWKSNCGPDCWSKSDERQPVEGKVNSKNQNDIPSVYSSLSNMVTRRRTKRPHPLALLAGPIEYIGPTDAALETL